MNIENNEYINELKRSGGVVLEYNKVKVSRLFEFLFLKQQIPYIFAYRNHKKIIVIDDNIGYTGGMNITGEYCSKLINGGINRFRDTHTRLQGDIVKYLKESIYWTVLDINPTLPPTQYIQDDDEDDDTDIDTDNEGDDEQSDQNDNNLIKNRGRVHLREVNVDDI